MTYQSNLNRSVEEHYDDPTSDRFLTDSVISVNTGRTNSARGEGTTTAELVAKFRFLNCCACLFILLFRTLPIILNPFRLISSPVKLMLEFLVAQLALSVFLVEARIPILGEKVLFLMRKFAWGRIQCMDLNVARGRFLALMIMGGSISQINYMAMNAEYTSSVNNDGGSPIEIPGGVNSTATNMAGFSPGNRSNTTTTSDVSNVSKLLAILQSTAFSPTVVILFSLSAFTLYVIRNFPEFAQVRAYEVQDESDPGLSRTESEYTRPSWVSSGFTRPSWVSNAFDSARGNGYQTMSV
ncbi:hypothetical protein ACHAXA_006086 [Cyclostephanos tholiformis]|uniref:Uncharacterized protein n=1 Tax=Cyclostephanos tholiformis TaxID=382380 RepID=A0ABD3SB65_9STRA